jgi:hypothetical protein
MRPVDALVMTGPIFLKETRKGILRWTDKQDIPVRSSFFWKRGNMQPPEQYQHSLLTIVIGDLVSSFGIGDIYLDSHHIWRIVQMKRLDMLINNLGVILGG